MHTAVMLANIHHGSGLVLVLAVGMVAALTVAALRSGR